MTRRFICSCCCTVCRVQNLYYIEMSLFKKFKQHLLSFPFIQPVQKQLVAVSGGVDSIVLCDLLFKAGYDFAIAHCNFQLRGEESDGDEQFVRKLAVKYNKEVFVQRFETEKYAAENKIAIQEAARNLRYTWFFRLVQQKKGEHIVTAHHADDNIETVVMNFFRGTGIRGLTGIGYQAYIFRPLLPYRKHKILEYAKKNELSYREDSSNALNYYTRNYFRNELLPGIREVFPAADKNILENIERFKEVEILYNQAIGLHKKKLLEYKKNEVHIPVLKLKKTQPLASVIFEIIKEYSFSSPMVEEVISLLESESGKCVQSATHRIIKNRNWLIISPNKTIEAENILAEEYEKEIEFAGGTLHFGQMASVSNFTPPAFRSIACVDRDKITFPLLLRKWKQGDYFYPLGMKKKKKLSRFFIDQKLSIADKEKVWVLEMDKKIIWVIGLRIDDRFKITPSTRNILKIELRMH